MMNKDFFKKVVVAINGSESSIHAAMYAIMMAASYKLQLKVVYVVDSATIRYLGMNQILIKSEQQEFNRDLTAEGQNYLDYVQSLAASKGIEIEKELRSGTVYAEIVKCASEYKADLIIIGGHEKKKTDFRIKKNVVSEHRKEIISNSTCPVLVVENPDIKAEFNLF